MPFDPLAPSTVGPWVLGPADPDEQALAHDVADNEPPPALQATVAEATKRARSAGVEPEIIWREILDAARDNNASKILLGVHHHRLLGALFGEDVDAAVRREANCDVIAVA